MSYNATPVKSGTAYLADLIIAAAPAPAPAPATARSMLVSELMRGVT